MIRLTIPRRGAIAVAVAVASGALVAGGAAAATPMPAHVYAPYFETWTADTINGVATASGARYFTLAFLETTGKTSCTLGWDGSKTQPVVANGRYTADIATLRSMGGDVIPSFGGWSADQGGTEIGDSCSNVNSIAAAYEQVVTTYDVTRLDMDIEGKSLTQDRRHRPPEQGDRAAPGVGHGERPDGPGPVHAADEPQRPRGERPGGAPERGRERRPDRRRQPDGLRLLRPAPAHATWATPRSAP